MQSQTRTSTSEALPTGHARESMASSDHKHEESVCGSCFSTAVEPVAHCSHGDTGSQGPWLTWIMTVLQTSPELLAERHRNLWFAVFLVLCFPALVAGMLVSSGHAMTLVLSSDMVSPRQAAASKVASCFVALCSWVGNRVASILVLRPACLHRQHFLGTVPSSVHRRDDHEQICHALLVQNHRVTCDSGLRCWDDVVSNIQALQ